MKKLIVVLSLLMLFMDSSYGFAGVMYKVAVKETAKKSPGIIVMLKSFGQKVLKQAPKAGRAVIKSVEGSGKFIVDTTIKHPVKTVVLVGGVGTAANYNVNEKFREDMNKFGTEIVSTAFGKIVTEPGKEMAKQSKSGITWALIIIAVFGGLAFYKKKTKISFFNDIFSRNKSKK